MRSHSFRRSCSTCIRQVLCSPLLLGLLVGLLGHYYQGPGGRTDIILQGGGGQHEESGELGVVEGEEEDGRGKTFTRPRFVKEELNTSKRLLISVVADNPGLQNLQETLLNTTLASLGAEVVFFGNFSLEEERLASRVRLAGGRHSLLRLLQHITGDLVSQYQLFLIIPSNSFVNGVALDRFLSTVDQFRDVYIGQKLGLGGSCGLEAGILLSQSLLVKLKPHMDWCLRNSPSHSPSQNLEQCISHAASLHCSPSSLSSLYTTQQYTAPHTALDPKALLYHGAGDPELSRALVLSMARQEQEETSAALLSLHFSWQQMTNTSRLLPPSSWPHLTSPGTRAGDRFDRDVFVRFNSSHSLNPSDEDVSLELGLEEREEVARVLEECSLGAAGLRRGWSKLDSSQGLHYLLEAGLQDSRSQHCRAVRELAEPTIVPVPFVTENSRLSLIVPVTEADLRASLALVRSFARNSIEKGDKVFLMLVFLYTPERSEKNNNNDYFKEVKQLALTTSKKYRRKTPGSAAPLLWYSLQTRGAPPSQLHLLDLVTAKLDNRSILLLGSPRMEVRPDYFNRVRMNTVAGRQVFCPVPWVEFHPRLAGSPANLAFNTSQGHFDPLDTGHVSFYKADYLAARGPMALPLLTKEAALPPAPAPGPTACSALGGSSALHTLTAPEPGLRLRYQEVTCSRHLAGGERTRCLTRRERSFGRRAQLAALVLGAGG